MSCNNNCNQGRTCNCNMNPFDDKHWKFSRTDPFNHTPFEEEDTASKLDSLIVVVCVIIAIGFILI